MGQNAKDKHKIILLFLPCDAYDPQVRLSKEDAGKIGKDLAFSTSLIVELTLALERQELREGAAAIQTSFRQCGGAKTAADLIEADIPCF